MLGDAKEIWYVGDTGCTLQQARETRFKHKQHTMSSLKGLSQKIA